MRDNVKGGALTEVTFCILLALYTPRHGYGVMRSIAEQTGGRLVLGAGTLYGALSTLQEKGWIEPWGETAGRKRQYAITPLGREVAKQELARLRALTAAAQEIMEGVQHEQGMQAVFRRAADEPGQLAEQDVGPGLAAGACGAAGV